jgi:hypothetical protein
MSRPLIEQYSQSFAPVQAGRFIYTSDFTSAFCSAFFSKELAIWWSAFSSKRLFIEMAFHRMACSLNAQLHLVFKTVSRISVALLHPKLLMI